MIAPPAPADEALRLLVLEECALLDTPPDPVFDAMTDLAATLCDTPIALVSLVDKSRQWFKARRGLEPQETPREYAFCGHAIAAAEPLVVEDAAADSRFADNPLVTGAPGIRFYAGCPIVAGDGALLGTVCVIDRVPRTLSEDQFHGLGRIAEMASALIDERRRNRMLLDQTAKASEQLRRLALTDSVTGALNRRGFLDQATWMGSGPGALVLMEIDSLDLIRAELGLSAAESVVKEVTALAQRVGHDGVVGRLQSAVLAVYLPDSDLDEGRALAERLRAILAAAPVDAAGEPYSATITAGVAAVVGPRGVEAALTAADTALTEARTMGGDQVVICARAAPPPPRQSLA
ncbi:Histidine kinase A [Caenispirillum salinarum AK4]|uniref:Histidine kinase A n=1 Tax=Caenispirillum salinarum AK4 TaxID=1238182 RepID=K9HG22_9PROT|nr:GAF domain-containing protein [Caenispirillum salinarum]EKV27576.1 Histidine kinase A [Caenispirillum salinarum AK4]